MRDLASILALDLGTNTGWALRHQGRDESGVQLFDVRRGESPGLRYVRFNAWLHEVMDPLIKTASEDGVALVGYEAPHHRGGAATEVANGFATRVQEYAARWQLEHVAVHSATLKKWVTGAGNAKKAMMRDAVYRRGWLPQPDAVRVDARSEDEIDAIGLLHYLDERVIGSVAPRHAR